MAPVLIQALAESFYHCYLSEALQCSTNKKVLWGRCGQEVKDIALWSQTECGLGEMGSSWRPRLEQGFHDHWRHSGLYRHEAMGNVVCLPAQGITHPTLEGPGWAGTWGQSGQASAGGGLCPASVWWGVRNGQGPGGQSWQRAGRGCSSFGHSHCLDGQMWGGTAVLCAQARAGYFAA